MTLEEGKERFIQAWGALGSSWGVNRTMAQIHALLLVSPVALNTDEVRAALKISTGNANMNIRALIDWGLVHKELQTGKRKDYFVAEKDMNTIIRQIVIQRKKRELEPMVKILDDVSRVENTNEEAAEFLKIVGDIKAFSNKADATLERLVRSESDWLTSVLLKLLR